MKEKKLEIIKKEYIHNYPLNYSRFKPLSGTQRVKKYKLNYDESTFHQTDTSMLGVFYKPSAIVFHDFKSE
ncbi:MAG: hypothetical protein AB8B56_01435 [Crocinitomicaceae bacterium]